MENVSKALIIAGSVLIGILILSLLVKSFTSVSLFQKAQLTEEEQKELIAFNEQYTKYLNQYVYGTEVISVINKTLDSKDSNYKVTTKIKFLNGYEYNGYVYNATRKKYEKKKITIKKGDTLTINTDTENNATVSGFINTMEESGELNTMAFKCTRITYNNATGRVESITFEEKQWGDLY